MKKTLATNHSSVSRHAGYQVRQDTIQCPFGNAFKTGSHKTCKKDISKNNQRVQLKRSLRED
jgi:hypothetical protein